MNKPAPSPSTSASKSRVLVLGSGDAGAHAAELLDQLGMDIAILDAPSVDRLDAARDAGYAIVVAGDGDDGGSMMLAVGFLLALLGRSRIVLLGGTPPAALAGCVQVPVDDEGLWRLLLAREMKKAGMEVDLNRAL
jgi:voltage-gated potassium channel Kch